MNQFNDILQQVYFGNKIVDYIWLVGLVLVGFIFKKYLSHIVSNILFKVIERITKDTTKDELFQYLHKPISWFLMLCIAYLASSHIEYPAEWDFAPKEEFGVRMVIHRTFLLFLVISITWVVLKVFDFLGIILVRKAEKTESKQDDQLIPFGVEIGKILIVIFAIFIILGNIFKVNITSLIAGLGIGGLALALAAKDSIENLFGSFTIFFDKPFIMGDFVKVGNVSGVVEKIGFRSTRVRTLEKSYLTVPNKVMINAEVDNLSLRTFRKASFNIGVTYSTSIEQVKNIVQDIQDFIDNHENTNQDGKVRFTGFGASSLDIMVMYFVDTMDWGVYLDVKQEINFKIMEIVEKHKSDFAFPTQTIHLEKDDK